MSETPGVIYCRCAYAQIVPEHVKDMVLRKLVASGREFEAVPDLCELSAKRDPCLHRFAHGGTVKIAACYPRAVLELFRTAGAPLDDVDVKVLNMRTVEGDTTVESFFAGE